MPAHFMDDGCHAHDNDGRNLFHDYAAVAENIGVYTALDYVDILDHFIKKWNIRNMTGLSPQAQMEQEYLCNLAAKIRRIAERVIDRKRKSDFQLRSRFSWVFNNEVRVQ